MNELETLPNGIEVPERPVTKGKRPIGSTVLISKSDFDYMQERHFRGRFAICNKGCFSGISTARRLATVLERDDRKIVLSIANARRTTKSPDGATWRTVCLASAYMTEDKKLCVIEIAPYENGGTK